MEKKTIKVKYVDFAKDFDENKNQFEKILKKHFDVIHDDNPEYVFFSNFGSEHLKYSDKVLIFYTGECETPNFNLCDYAIGFDFLSFGDRYCRVPLYHLFQYEHDYELAKEKHLKAEDIFNEKREGCSFVVSNEHGMPERETMFDLLSEHLPVYSGGKFRNNIGCCVPDKQEFMSKYKFNIAFENCISPGYTTEKIMQSFASGAIPIYLGDPRIKEYVNPKAFINCSDFNSLEEAVDYVLMLDKDDERYHSMLGEPAILEKGDSTLEEFICSIMKQEYHSARRRPMNERIKWIEEDCVSLEEYKGLLKRKDKLLHPIKRIKRTVGRLINKHE